MRRQMFCVAAVFATLVAGRAGAAPGSAYPVIINEFSQGAGGVKEWVELQVVAPNLDLRDWQLGENDDGLFVKLLSFNAIPLWQAVPAGTLIVIYNGGDIDPAVQLAGAPDTNAADRILLLSGTDATYFTETGQWPASGQFANDDRDDGPALRNAASAMIHNLVVTHPTPAIPTPVASSALGFAGAAGDEVATNINWATTTAGGATPGAGNSVTNSAWIATLIASSSNSPPILLNPGNWVVRESNTLAFAVTANQTGGDAVTLSVSNLPPGAAFASTGEAGTFTWEAPAPTGVYVVVFQASDTDGVSVASSQIDVLPVLSGASFGVDWLAIPEGAGSVTSRIPVHNPGGGDATAEVAVAGVAAHGAGGDVMVSPTQLIFAAGASTQWLDVVVLPDALMEGPEWCVLSLVVPAGAPPGELTQCVVRVLDDDSVSIATANLSSQTGPANSVYADPGQRILRGLAADVIAIQEFNVTNSGGHAAFVSNLFGTGWSHYVEEGGGLPNGVISRWPITATGEWDDLELSDRDFAWATIDLPGGVDLHIVSVHFKAGDGGTDLVRREHEARQLTNYLAVAGWPTSDYVVLAGDLNQASRSEDALAVLTTVVHDAHQPTDQNGDDDTNLSHTRPYDYILPATRLNALHQPLPFGGLVFPEGLVYDSRLWPTNPPPIRADDSADAGMQHLAVMKLYALPASTNAPPEDGDSDGLPDAWETAIFTNLTVAGIETDYDHDGQMDWAEYRSGTHPQDAASLLRITAASAGAAEGWALAWTSVSNHTYMVLQSGDVVAGFVTAVVGLAASPPENVVTNLPQAEAGPQLFRIEVE